MSKLLIEESPLTFQPSLAVAIGLNEAIVLQQIHYWIKNTKNKGYEQDGYKWVYNTYAKWKETNFPFWSENTIQRTFASLEEKGLVVSIQPMKGKYDRTKYYRIEYTKLEVFDDPKMVCSLSESETTTENNDDDSNLIPKDLVDGILELSQAPGIKREARINDILNYLGVTFRRNTSTKEWLVFAKYIDSEFQSKGWNVKQFVSWLFGQKDYNPNYWPVKKMMEFYPSAFAEKPTVSSMFETLS